MPANRLYWEEVRRFENRKYALKEFSHREHLRVAWTYLQLFGYDAALEKMRAGLLKFTAHHGASGFNETITVFWMKMLATHHGEDPEQFLPRASKELLYRHYTRERALSVQAKQQWLEPDLLPL